MEIQWTDAKNKYAVSFFWRYLDDPDGVRAEIKSWFDGSFSYSDIGMIVSLCPLEFAHTRPSEPIQMACPWDSQADLEADLEAAKTIGSQRGNGEGEAFGDYPYTLAQSVRLTWDEVKVLGQDYITDKILHWDPYSIKERGEPDEVYVEGRGVYLLHEYLLDHHPEGFKYFQARFYPNEKD